jgi:chaperonin cofactor prefoldin
MNNQIQDTIRQYDQMLAEISAVEFQFNSILHELERHNYLIDINKEERNEEIAKRVGQATT